MFQVLKEGLVFKPPYVYEYTFGEISNKVFAGTAFRDSVKTKLLELLGGGGHKIDFSIKSGSSFSQIPDSYCFQAPGGGTKNEWKVFNRGNETEITIEIK